MALQVCLLSYCFRYSSVWQFQVVLAYSIISIIWWFFFLHLSVFESFYSFLKFRSFPPERLQYVLCCRVSWIFWYNLHWSFWRIFFDLRTIINQIWYQWIAGEQTERSSDVLQQLLPRPSSYMSPTDMTLILQFKQIHLAIWTKH